MLKFEKGFSLADNVLSSVIKGTHAFILLARITYLDWNFANLIYLGDCSKCHLEYVGKNVKKMNGKSSVHKTGDRNPSRHGHCQVFCNHFTNGMGSNIFK